MITVGYMWEKMLFKTICEDYWSLFAFGRSATLGQRIITKSGCIELIAP